MAHSVIHVRTGATPIPLPESESDTSFSQIGASGPRPFGGLKARQVLKLIAKSIRQR
jgi:hypothetical protein